MVRDPVCLMALEPHEAADVFTNDRRASKDDRRRLERRIVQANSFPGAKRHVKQSRRINADRRLLWPGADLDARGLICPGPLLKVRKRAAALRAGERLRVRADDPSFPSDFLTWAQRSGVRILHVYTSPSQCTVICEKSARSALTPPMSLSTAHAPDTRD